jgi:small basic protein (TIGR04137 family)
MTIHRSLKTKSGALSQHRNVLTRAERITKLSSQEKFEKSKNSPLGLVKVGNLVVGGKKKKAATEDKAAAPAAGGKAAAPAAGAKAAAPAAGGKAAAPAAGAKAPAGKK